MIDFEVYTSIYVNGVLLSRRYITDLAGTAVTQADVSSIKLSVYVLGYDNAGASKRTPVENYDSVSLNVDDVITQTVQTDAAGNNYNFEYCVEGAFTIPDTRYCVEYVLTMTDNHTVVIPIYGKTQN